MAQTSGGGSYTCTRRNILFGLLISTLLVIFLTHQMTPFLNGGTSFFQIHNFVNIGFFSSYDEYENTGNSVYNTLPMEPGALCNIPSLDPFNANALRLIAGDGVGKDPIKCLRRDELVKFYPEHGNLVRVNFNGRPSMAEAKYWETVKCCYIGYWGNGNRGNESSAICEPILSSITPIPSKYDFINVKCYKLDSDTMDYQDQFEFFRLKHSKSSKYKRSQSQSQSRSSPTPASAAPNILFIGLDSVSHVHFIRSFPKSHQFLMQQLGAIEFFGHNKISVATQGNVLAMLTGCRLEKNSQIPELMPNARGDGRPEFCDLVWNKYKQQNYTVLRAEDDLGLNNEFFTVLRTQRHLPLTDEQISDYRWTPYIREMKRLNTAKANQFTFGCFDYQWVQHLLFERILNVAETFGAPAASRHQHQQEPYFHFTWTATTAHDVIGYARYLDDPLYMTLTKLSAKQFLNNTILVLASDHGMAYGTYSRTNAGSIESRMPLLYFVFPEWFYKRFSKAIENMKTNTMRLTSPFDLHETLLDLADLRSITDQALETRERTRTWTSKMKKSRGQSLFLPVPVNRTCELAGIPDEWCICWTKSSIESPADDADIQEAARVALGELNGHLHPFAKCAQLELDEIEAARRLSSRLLEKSSYEIVFKTRPGGALYEVSVAKTRRGGGGGQGAFRVLGGIVRVNAYGTRGACLEEYEKGDATANPKRTVPYLVNSACHCMYH